MNCEAIENLLLEYVEHELPDDEAGQVTDHLHDCTICAAKARRMREMLGIFSAARSLERGVTTSAAPATPPQPAPAPLQRLGDFEILGELGRGGMGVVYRARQVTLNRVVALKVLSPQLVQAPRAVERFRKEAQAAARLHHTNIVPIYAQGEEDAYVYYAMELVEGESLSAVLARDPLHLGADPPPATPDPAVAAADLAPTVRLPSEGAGHPRSTASQTWLRSAVSAWRGKPERGPRDYKRIARLMAEVAEGLQHAHDAGIIHRDIKPQNLLLGRDDKLHVTDFGLARLLDEPGLTLSMEIVGTPAYMAPEQLSGDRRAIGPRTDIFALGATLYELLTRRRAFPGETYDQVITAVLKRDPPAPRRIDPHVPTDLDTICMRALEKEPTRRFGSAADLARDLRRYAENFPIVSRRIGPLGRIARWTRRHPARAAAGAAIALVVMLLPLLAYFVRSAGAAQVAAARTLLLNDYRNVDQARAQLGWAAELGGPEVERGVVDALLHIRHNSQRAIDALNPLIASHPDNRELLYLMAWALNWAGRTDEQYRYLERGDNSPQRESAAALFFKGQSLVTVDPRAARRAFQAAITTAGQEGWTFPQAMEHLGRATNFLIYYERNTMDPEEFERVYEDARATLRSAAELRRTKAYPRYLLARLHLLAAEAYAIRGDETARERATRAAQASASEAREVEPTSGRGYIAEAEYFELVGQFDQAIQTLLQIDPQRMTVLPIDANERDTNLLRLYFRAGDYARARERLRLLSTQSAGEVATHADQVGNLFLSALLSASLGEPDAALRELQAAARTAPRSAEALLLVDAGHRLTGLAGPETLLSDIDWNRSITPNWDAAWQQLLVRFRLEQAAWNELLAAAVDATGRPSPSRRAAAWFYRGVAELTAGHRDQAQDSLLRASREYDNETYCWRAKLLWYRLAADPAWPASIQTGSRP